MGYFIQQSQDQLVIAIEILKIYQTNRIRLRLMDDEAYEVEKRLVDRNIYFDPEHVDQGLFELSIYLFDEWMPLERIWFNRDFFEKSSVMYPSSQYLIKEDIGLKIPRLGDMTDYDNKYDASEKEFADRLEEKVHELNRI
jgi:hypothetical protein